MAYHAWALPLPGRRCQDHPSGLTTCWRSKGTKAGCTMTGICSRGLRKLHDLATTLNKGHGRSKATRPAGVLEHPGPRNGEKEIGCRWSHHISSLDPRGS